MGFDKTVEQYKVDAAKDEAEYWKFKKIAAEHDAEYAKMHNEMMEERVRSIKVIKGV